MMRGLTLAEYEELRALFGPRGEYTFHMPTLDALAAVGRVQIVKTDEESSRVSVTELGKLAMDLWPATQHRHT